MFCSSVWTGPAWSRSVDQVRCLALLLGGLAAGQPAIACSAAPVSMTDMATAAERSYDAMDEDAFFAARRLLTRLVSCLNAEPEPSEVAVVYRVEALAAFMSGDEPGAVGWLRAMLEADPTATIPTAFAPPGHALRALFEHAQTARPSTRAIARVYDPCVLTVDGVAAHDVPLERPSLVVIRSPEGRVLWSGLLPANPLMVAVCASDSDDHLSFKEQRSP